MDWAVGQLTRPGHVRATAADVIGLRDGSVTPAETNSP